MDFTQYGKPATIRHMFIGAGVGFFLAGLVSALANPVLGIIIVLVGVVGEALMGGRKPTTGIPKV